MSIHCVVCKQATQCYKCQIKDLKLQVEKLTYELSYLRKGSNKQLIKEIDFSKHFETDNKFLPINYYGQMSDYQFLTITFDPQKFGLFNQPSDEQNYIFQKLWQSTHTAIIPRSCYITQLTGCFEYQKNGTTHAHIIIRTEYKPKEIEDYFRPFFTDDPKNKYAIKCYPLQKAKCEAYLQKESTEYYRYDKSFNDLEDVEPYNDSKSKISATLQDINKIVSLLVESHKVEQQKLFNKLCKQYNITAQSLHAES